MEFLTYDKLWHECLKLVFDNTLETLKEFRINASPNLFNSEIEPFDCLAF